MGYLIAAGVVIFLLYLLVVYVIAPISGILLSVTLILGIGYALFTSLRSFITSLAKHINPYTTYLDNSPGAPPGIKRDYFFGPGYHQISRTVSEAFSLQNDYLATLGNWKNDHLLGSWFVSMWIWIFYLAAMFCTFVFGFAWMSIFSILLSVILFTGMCCFYVFFSSLWCADRLFLMVHAIQCRCPRCKRVSIVPSFSCPKCGFEHKNLTPGPYGILTRKCVCEERLATTCLNGRSEYTAICPFDGSELAASNARQFGIQLVGGVNTGKTTFLAAFWHEYLERIKKIQNISVKPSPKDGFAELEYWFQHGDSSATTETNANMYSLIHRHEKGTPVQMTIYDIAGEAFTSLGSDIQQQQFQYCEGIVFVIDPTANPMYVSVTVTNFANEFRKLKGKRSMKTADVPVAVIITKADLHKRTLGLPIIKATFVNNAQNYADSEGNTSLELVRNGMCRRFLEEYDFGNVINLIDGEFSRVQYYSVSAMGHSAADGLKYEPWGVLEPIAWILKQQGDVFRDIIPGLD
jgi:GTPase SAR1 family protein